ncbi:MAG: FtsX-like permease family protein [bacterium]|nr:FtsX-like permease family protein [bacterium]
MKIKKKSPPAIAARILGWLLPENERFVLLGDYEELFQDRAADKSTFSAVMWYWSQILITFPEYIFESLLRSVLMIKNYLKITIRTLLKNKIFSVINITGIALSIAICLMIIIYIKDWRNTDQFHVNKDRIYRIISTDTKFGWDINGWATTPGYLAPYLLQNYPIIENSFRLRQMYGSVVHKGTAVGISGFYAEPSFFEMLNFELLEGDRNTALDNPYSVIISEDYAMRFFGDEDPMFKTLSVEIAGSYTENGVLRDKGELIVTGIVKSTDEKTHLNFNCLVSFSTLPSLVTKGILKNELEEWRYMSRFYTYVLLNDPDNITAFEQQLPEIENSIIPEDNIEQFGFELQNICDINLGKNLSNATPGTKSSIDVFFIPFLAAMIVFLVCFNYIILSIARSLKRSREIGLRKVIGSKRSQIIKLFLSEAFVITFLALIMACIFILWLVPIFNNMDVIENTQQQINLEAMKDPGIYITFILLAFGISIIAGLYPAIYLSSIRPVNALHGVSRIKGFSQLLMRKILMGIQFGISLISIIFIIYFNLLFDFWMSYDRGIDVDNIVNVYLGDVNNETVKNELSKNSLFTGISLSSEIPLYGGGSYTSFKTANMVEPISAYNYNVDMEFIDNFKLKIEAGRNFSNEYTTDTGKAVIINEKTVQALGLDSPVKAVGMVLTLGDESEVTVIGVVKDFTYRLFFEDPIGPMIIVSKPESFRYANIRYLPENKEEIKAFLPEIWKEFDEVHKVRFSFSDDAQEEYETIISGTITISSLGGGLVILIALFGLLGMTAYTTELKIKEIGIRKILGESVKGSVYLLSKSYIKLIMYTAVVALPSGYFLSDLTFQFFPIRPDLSLWVPPAALLFILFLALNTVGSQTIKAALANPINTLREE